MPLKKKLKPAILVLESEASENIVLGLENLQVINKTIKSAIDSNNERLDHIRKILGGI